MSFKEITAATLAILEQSSYLAPSSQKVDFKAA